MTNALVSTNEAFHTTERAACKSGSGSYSSEPVRGSQPDSKFLCNCAPRASRMPQIGNLGLIDIRARPPETLALRACVAQTGLDPLLDKRTFKLRHGRRFRRPVSEVGSESWEPTRSVTATARGWTQWELRLPCSKSSCGMRISGLRSTSTAMSSQTRWLRPTPRWFAWPSRGRCDLQ